MTKLLKLIFIIGILNIFLVVAHLDVGVDKVVDGYLIDFGYGPENPTTEDKVSMNMVFLNESTRGSVDIDSVWLRFSNPEEVVFAGTMKPDQSIISWTYVFPKAGNYDIEARFIKDGETLSESSFNLEIKPAGKSSLGKLNLFLIILTLALVIYIIKKEKAFLKGLSRKKK